MRFRIFIRGLIWLGVCTGLYLLLPQKPAQDNLTPRLSLELSESSASQITEQLWFAQTKPFGTSNYLPDTGIPAKLEIISEHRSRNLNAYIQLKGNSQEHFTRGFPLVPSLSVKLKKGKYWRGARHFSIQPYSTRSSYYTPFLNSITRGVVPEVMCPPTSIIPFYHGVFQGIWHVEPKHTSILMEQQRKRVGIIAKLDSQGYWEDHTYLSSIKPKAHFYPHSDWRILPFKLLQADRIQKRPLLSAQAREFKSKFQGAQRGDLPLSDLLDIQLWARVIAMLDLLGTPHTLETHNIRFYFNPDTRRVEPVVYDWFAEYQPNQSIGAIFWQSFVQSCFQDPAFRAEYPAQFSQVRDTLRNKVNQIKTLEQNYRSDYIAAGCNIDETREILPDMLTRWGHLKAEMPVSTAQVTATSYYLRDTTESMFRQPTLQVTQDAQGQVQVLNPYPIPLQLQPSIVGPDLPAVSLPPSELLAAPALNLLNPLPKWTAWPYDKPPNTLEWVVDSPYLEQVTSFKLSPHGVSAPYKGTGSTTSLPAYLEPVSLQGEPVAYHIYPTGGTIQVTQSLKLEGEMIIHGGAHIQFADNVSWHIIGSLTCKGTAEAPIQLDHPSILVSSGSVLAQGRSLLKYVNIHRPKDALATQLGIPGGVTFAYQQITADHATFKGDTLDTTEDMLNLVNCNILLSNLQFVNTPSDGLDLDFCKGFIANLQGTEIGGDLLDLSGSDITLNSIAGVGIKDKLISAGEGSTIIGTNIYGRGCLMGIVSKDGSQVKLQGVKLFFTKHTFATYSKKPYFDQASSLVVTEANSTIGLLNQKTKAFPEGHNLQINDTDFKPYSFPVEVLYP